jgi:energy-coupling factor transporter ATP-binding protein EcfA2
MNIFDHFQHINLTNDQRQALEKLHAFLESDERVFILKGYAGSGKTTLIKGLVNSLASQKKNFSVIAPTGRAAKVLREKTGCGITIHKGIYDFNRLETIKDDSEDIAEKSFRYHFPVKIEHNAHRIVIVDESSMIFDTQTEHELFQFGSGRLLHDLLSFMQFHQAGNKIIFVGDPAQLPPFSDSISFALEENYFTALNLSCSSYEMKEVARQAADSLILKNATKIRELLENDHRDEFSLELNNKECIQIPSIEASDRYIHDFPFPEVGNGVIICFSNAQCLSYNQLIRKRLFPDSLQIIAGDIVLINNNNYHTYGAELFNGDMAKVIWASDQTTSQTAPVMVSAGAKRIRKNITLVFRDIKIRLPNYDREISCKVIDTLLNSPERDLSIYEMKALYINFIMRFDEEQKLRAARGLKKFRHGSDEFKEQLKADPYFNALRIKYGYSITCHKAQGGEWVKAYVDFFGRVGLSNDHLRWCYTAITRASQTLFAINPPAITSFSKLSFSPIGKIGDIPANAFQYNNIPTTPFHASTSHPAKRLKYFEIQKQLNNSPFEILRVESRSHQEMYFLKYDSSELRIDAWHTEAGIFTTVKVQTKTEVAEKLEDIFKLPYHYDFSIEYSPSNKPLTELFNMVQVACAETNVQITNVEERIDKYHVIYYFITSGKVSYIQFFFKQNGQFSTAIPKSDLGNNDQLLIVLIQKLSENVI